MIDVRVYGTGAQGKYIDACLHWPSEVDLPVAGGFLRLRENRFRVERVLHNVTEDSKDTVVVDLQVSFVD